MKRQMIILLILFIVSLCNFAYAENMINSPIINEFKNMSIIDSNSTRYIHFEFSNDIKPIYCNKKVTRLHSNRYAVKVTNMHGTQNIIIRDSLENELQYTYYFSEKNGKINGYELVNGKELNVFVTTFKGIQIIYTDNQSKEVEKLKEYIVLLPSNMIVNLKQILMIPYSNTAKIAGSTFNSRITLYNFAKYDEKTQKNIIFHEIAHTWANKMINDNELDNEYTGYKEYVVKDDNFISKYSENFSKDNSGVLSEDFADGIAFYFIDKESFKDKHPNRTEYFDTIIK